MKNKIYKITFVLFILVTAPMFLHTGCSDNGETSGDLVYYCPMHPEVQSNKPGVCPICHMDLVLREQDGNDMTEHLEESIVFNNRKLALANINTVEVKSEKLVKEINSFSYLDFAEEKRRNITARFSGRIEKLFVDKTGDYVSKGDRLFEIYSPDLIQAQNDYLLAVKNFDNIALSNGSAQRGSIKSAARNKLLYLGVTDSQIEELESSGEVNYSITYYSPFSGTVIEKRVQEGMYVNEGSLIYDVADLSVLWSISEMYSADLALIKPGSRVQMNLQSYPGKIFEGKVDLIYPVVSPETRTVKVRSVFNNNNNLLKPNMYGETIFSVNLGEGIVIPSEAIIFTGDQGKVWVETEPGSFRARDVKTGYRLNGRYQILSGLKQGEKVAAEGSYLIDSESQLSGSSASKGHQDHSYNNVQDKNKSNAVINGRNGLFNEVCPVLGNKIPADAVFVEYEGKKIGFCCPGCDKKFLSDPERYMKNLSNDGKKFTKQS